MNPEKVDRAVAIHRRYGTDRAGRDLAQRITQATGDEIRKALSLVGDAAPAPVATMTAAPEARMDVPIDPHPDQAQCPTCGSWSRSALLGQSCDRCGAAWGDIEGRTSPAPGGAR
jgi:hypothetical protein